MESFLKKNVVRDLFVNECCLGGIFLRRPGPWLLLPRSAPETRSPNPFKAFASNVVPQYNGGATSSGTPFPFGTDNGLRLNASLLPPSSSLLLLCPSARRCQRQGAPWRGGPRAGADYPLPRFCLRPLASFLSVNLLMMKHSTDGRQKGERADALQANFGGKPPPPDDAWKGECSTVNFSARYLPSINLLPRRRVFFSRSEK